MATTVRIGTFNMENLFTRAKALNLLDRAETTAILDDVAALERLLGKTTYTSADKKEIVRLVKEQGEYVEIREDRGKLFTGRGANRRVTASGAGAWDGAVVFKRDEISQMARKSTADVVKALDADLLCTVEVEDRKILQDFNSQALGGKKFTYSMVIDGNDPRGIDVGVLTNFVLANIRTHIFDRDATGFIFSRDCLEVELRLPDGRSLTILANHLKSQGYGAKAANDAKRRRQATRVAAILSGYNLTKEFVVVAGDMNDKPDSAALQPLLGVSGLTDVLDLQLGAGSSDRWTYKYKNKLDQIDFLLVSDALKAGFKRAGIERRGLFGVKAITGETPFASVTSPTSAASDHCAVWAEFSV